MKKQLIIATSIAIFICLVISCQKEEDLCLACEPCKDYVYTTRGHVIGNKLSNSEEYWVCFNPNDSNEFIYVKKRSLIHDLVKYNLSSQKEVILLSNVSILFQPKWGKNNLILFNDEHFQLFTIRPDGTDLRLIKTKASFSHLEWKNDSIIVGHYRYSTATFGYFASLNINTSKLDSINNNYFIQTAYNDKGEYCYQNRSYLKFESNNKTITLIDSTYGSGVINDCKWHPNNVDIYYSTNVTGLFKINKNTKQITKIKSACDTRRYKEISISSDGKKIIVHRVDSPQPKDNATPEEDAGIYLMDIDGKNEVKLFQ
jgi:hypothetical protein